MPRSDKRFQKSLPQRREVRKGKSEKDELSNCSGFPKRHADVDFCKKMHRQ
jgi:hypothetical protein